jgi:hypothetical protein
LIFREVATGCSATNIATGARRLGEPSASASDASRKLRLPSTLGSRPVRNVSFICSQFSPIGNVPLISSQFSPFRNVPLISSQFSPFRNVPFMIRNMPFICSKGSLPYFEWKPDTHLESNEFGQVRRGATHATTDCNIFICVAKLVASSLAAYCWRIDAGLRMRRLCNTENFFYFVGAIDLNMPIC